MLIVGPLAGPLAAAARMAQARGAQLAQADRLPVALAHLRGPGADLVLCHVEQNVVALLGAMTAERMACPVIACGPEDASTEAEAAVRAGARDYLPLPPDADLIAAMLEAAAAAVTRESGMIAQDPVTLGVLARAAQVARADAAILITGESGTGKEVLARHVHATSRRADGPFVAINCAALPETLLESELFGHEKGAFSGAVAARKGRFEQADGGTLLLDEIGEMDLRLQAKLLRVVQQKEVDRLGGTRPVRVDVRILAATNRDLQAEVAAGRFREDLYFRLDVVRLHLPPLRDRPGDILPLAESFARRYAEANGLPNRRFSTAARASLRAHAWPGNVRELENAIHRAVLLADGPEIAADAIELRSTRGAPAPAATTAAAGIEGFVGRKVEEVERDLILHTLAHCLGNRTRAAEVLGISIRALRNKLHDYRAMGMAVPAAPGYGIAAAGN
jgi:DNA-binding NtrC family response regulator